MRLKNVASPTELLPDFVAGMAGPTADVKSQIRTPAGTMLSSVRLVGTKGARLQSALTDGQKVPVFTGSGRGHPTFEVQVFIPPGKSGELVFHLTEPTAPGEARVAVQPLVDDVVPKVSVPECAKWVKRAGFKLSRYSPGILCRPARREVVDRPSEVDRFVGIRHWAEGRKYVNGGIQR